MSEHKPIDNAPLDLIFALPLRLGGGTGAEAPIFDRHGELVGECVDDDCEERALAFVRAVNEYAEITRSEQSTFEISARLLRERNQWRDMVILALPYLEDAEHDSAYKKGSLRSLISRIRQANSSSYDPTTQPFDEPFRHVEPVPKAWNGGSVESAIALSKQSQEELLAQGATLCGACNGEGAMGLDVCVECCGAGVILPADGLTLEDEIVLSRTGEEL